MVLRRVSSVIFLYPTSAFKLSMACGVGCVPLLNPNPQAFTRGATVMSKAPSVSSETFMASSTTCMNISFSSVFSLRFTFEMMLLSLNIERASSTFFSSASISFCRFSSLW